MRRQHSVRALQFLTQQSLACGRRQQPVRDLQLVSRWTLPSLVDSASPGLGLSSESIGRRSQPSSHEQTPLAPFHANTAVPIGQVGDSVNSQHDGYESDESDYDERTGTVEGAEALCIDRA